MRKLGWLGCVLGAWLAACSGPSEGATEQGEVAELNENKALGMTDVTILYPPPKTADFFDDMLGPSSELDKGELLPASLFAQLAALKAPPMMGAGGQVTDQNKPLFADWADSFSLMRVVGIRLDPCFGETTNLAATTCENTIRLTAQFFLPQRTAADGRSAIHLFYKITREELTAIAKGLLQLRKDTGLPLQKGLMTSQNFMHPTLAEQGLRGPYATGLKDLMLKYIGEKTLTRIAFCVEDRANASGGYYGQNNGRVADSRWVFGGFDYRGGALQPLPISTLDYSGLQTVDSTPFATNRDPVVVTPAIAVRDNFLQAFNKKPEANGTLDPEKMEKARRASLTLQNPTKYTTKTADCVSCHMANLAAPNHPADALDFKSYTFRLDHSNDLIGAFRMFGYDTSGRPVMAARVVNETAVVLEFLNTVVMR